ncbi:MAG TPA: hypothetical protein VEL07_21000 [Planctomycetota bacterium]|nr:hypothetical protein [Planctomycetota bacterium]
MRALMRVGAACALAACAHAHVLAQGDAELAVVDDVVAVELTVDRSAMLMGIGRADLVADADADIGALIAALTAYAGDALLLAGDDGVERAPDAVAWRDERWDPAAPGGRMAGRYVIGLRWRGLRARRALDVRSRLHLGAPFAEHTQLVLRLGGDALTLAPGTAGTVALAAPLGRRGSSMPVALASLVAAACAALGVTWALRRASARRRDSRRCASPRPPAPPAR